MNNILKRIISSILLISILFYTMPILAYTSEENIYVKLDKNGKSYKTIVNSNEKDGYNQVETDKELPIECKITYFLNGEEISSDEIAGKSGKIKIKIEYINKLENEVKINDKFETLYTPFLVLTGAVISNDKNSNIVVTNGKIINEGDKTLVLAYAMPGMQESLKINEKDFEIPSSIEIEFDTEGFEMKNIMTVALPKVINEKIDLNEKFDELYNEISKLQVATNKIEDGAVSLRNGISNLNDGAIKLNDGTITLNNGTQELAKGINNLNNGVQSLGTGTGSLAKGIGDVNDGAQSLSQGLEKVKAGSEQLSSGANTLNSQYVQLDSGIQNLVSGTQNLPQAVEQIKNGFLGVGNGLTNLKSNLQDTQNSINSLSSVASQVNQGLVQINSLADNLPSQSTCTSSTTLQVDNSASINSINTAEGSNNVAISTLQSTISSLDSLKNGENDAEIEAYKGQIQTAIENINSANGSISEAKINMKTEVTGEAIATITNPDISSLKASIAGVSGGAEKLSGGMNELSQGFGGFVSGTEGIIDGNTALSAGFNNLATPLEELAKNAEQLSVGSTAVKNGIQNLTNGTVNLNNGIASANTGATQLADGTKRLNDGTKDLTEGSKALINGVEKLKEGGDKLSNGSCELANATNSLKDGTNQLLDGSNKLVNGIKEYNNTGITKIYNKVNVDGRKFINRINVLQELSMNYDKFSKDESSDSIKFIYMIDSIKQSKQQETNENAIISDTKNKDDNNN